MITIVIAFTVSIAIGWLLGCGTMIAWYNHQKVKEYENKT